CPASQSDVSVYQNLLFVSGEGMGGRLDCGTEGVHDSVSAVRLRGLRIFDISDIANPKYVANVQTCRGSHTHSVVTDLNDPGNVYVYISGAAPVRSPSELPGCVAASPDSNPNSARFRIEVIKVPLAAPQQAAIVSSPRIFDSLTAPATHAEAPEDVARAAKAATEARAKGGYTAAVNGLEYVLRPGLINPVRDNDGTKLLFTDEWGGGGGPKCRATDRREWGADAIFTLDDKKMTFRSYYKLPAPQTELENCVAHNGSLIPIPGRDIMVQSWYQGG